MQKIIIYYKNGKSYTLRGYFVEDKYGDEIRVRQTSYKDGVSKITDIYVDTQDVMCVVVSKGANDKRLITYNKNHHVRISADNSDWLDGMMSVCLHTTQRLDK